MGRLKKIEEKVDLKAVTTELPEEIHEAVTVSLAEKPSLELATIRVGNREITGVVTNGILAADDGTSYAYHPEVEVV